MLPSLLQYGVQANQSLIYVKQNTLNIFITWHNTIALLAKAINYQYTNLQLARLSLFPQLG